MRLYLSAFLALAACGVPPEKAACDAATTDAAAYGTPSNPGACVGPIISQSVFGNAESITFRDRVSGGTTTIVYVNDKMVSASAAAF